MSNIFCESIDEQLNCETDKKKVGPIWPSGDGVLHIYDDYRPLFTSATWAVTAKLNGKIVTATVPASKPHDERFIKRWAQYLIRNRKEWLRENGVDVFSEYAKWGGNMEELKDEPLLILVN